MINNMQQSLKEISNFPHSLLLKTLPIMNTTFMNRVKNFCDIEGFIPNDEKQIQMIKERYLNYSYLFDPVSIFPVLLGIYILFKYNLIYLIPILLIVGGINYYFRIKAIYENYYQELLHFYRPANDAPIIKQEPKKIDHDIELNNIQGSASIKPSQDEENEKMKIHKRKLSKDYLKNLLISFFYSWVPGKAERYVEKLKAFQNNAKNHLD